MKQLSVGLLAIERGMMNTGEELTSESVDGQPSSYVQGGNQLYTETVKCPLGVLIDIGVLEVPEISSEVLLILS